MSRPTNAYIDLSALQDNLIKLCNEASKSKVIAVVKANAYGNGAIKVAKHIEDRVDILAVAFLSEAQELRKADITKPILILQGPHSEEDFEKSEFDNFIWVLHSNWQLDAFQRFSLNKNNSNKKHKVWLKFDSGMHRLGFGLDSFYELVKRYANIINPDTVIMSHLACADEKEQSHALLQIKSFLKKVESSGFPICIANSAAHIRFSHARKAYVRVGIAMYGSTPFSEDDNPIGLKPVMHLNSKIIALRQIAKGECVGYGATWCASKDSIIATVALGYADGYPRHAPVGTPAFCNGKKVPLVGRVSMDMLTFDVSDLRRVEIGDDIQLWGDKLEINEVAAYINTIGYELMTRVSQRVPRIYSV